MIIEYQFLFNTVNTSAQAGDVAYYVSTSAQGGFDQDSGNISVLGIITLVGDGFINIAYDDAGSVPLPSAGEYLMFAKDKRANTSSLLGYYAEVELTNNSHEYAEIFSINSEVEESSK